VVTRISGSAFVLISNVDLHWARLVLGWATIFVCVNHLGIEPLMCHLTLVIPLWVS